MHCLTSSTITQIHRNNIMNTNTLTRHIWKHIYMSHTSLLSKVLYTTSLYIYISTKSPNFQLSNRKVPFSHHIITSTSPSGRSKKHPWQASESKPQSQGSIRDPWHVAKSHWVVPTPRLFHNKKVGRPCGLLGGWKKFSNKDSPEIVVIDGDLICHGWIVNNYIYLKQIQNCLFHVGWRCS